MSGWLIFELQMVCLSNIPSISKPQLAAGAVWVQCEGALASVQAGWIQSTKVRTLTLLGKQDPGASSSFALLTILSVCLAALTCIPLLTSPDGIARGMTNDPAVQHSFSGIIWLLVPHVLTRIPCILPSNLLIPMGFKIAAVTITFASFYLVATPVSTVMALTDIVTHSVHQKMLFALGTATIAQVIIALVGYGYMWLCVNWSAAGRLIVSRAHTDGQWGRGRETCVQEPCEVVAQKVPEPGRVQ